MRGLRPIRAWRRFTWKIPSPTMRTLLPLTRCFESAFTVSLSIATARFVGSSWASAIAMCFSVTTGNVVAALAVAFSVGAVRAARTGAVLLPSRFYPTRHRVAGDWHNNRDDPELNLLPLDRRRAGITHVSSRRFGCELRRQKAGPGVCRRHLRGPSRRRRQCRGGLPLVPAGG